jgi:hypothetical protein
MWRARRAVRRTAPVVAMLLLAGGVVVTAARAVPFDAFTPVPQLAPFAPLAGVGLFVALICFALCRMKVASIVAVSLVIVHVLWLAPRFMADGGRSGGGTPLRIMTVNAQHGNTPAGSIKAMADRERIDVLVVTELTPELAAELAGVLPYKAENPGPVASGLGLYSRHPMKDIRTIIEGQSPYPMAGATLTVGGKDVRVQGVHPHAPYVGSVALWAHDFDALTREAGRTTVPTVFAGDFNATQEHASFRKLLDKGGLRDAHEDRGRGLVRTWGGLFQLDHVLVPGEFDVRSTEERRLPKSEHTVLIVELGI